MDSFAPIQPSGGRPPQRITVSAVDNRVHVPIGQLDIFDSNFEDDLFIDEAEMEAILDDVERLPPPGGCEGCDGETRTTFGGVLAPRAYRNVHNPTAANIGAATTITTAANAPAASGDSTTRTVALAGRMAPRVGTAGLLAAGTNVAARAPPPAARTSGIARTTAYTDHTSPRACHATITTQRAAHAANKGRAAGLLQAGTGGGRGINDAARGTPAAACTPGIAGTMARTPPLAPQAYLGTTVARRAPPAANRRRTAGLSAAGAVSDRGNNIATRRVSAAGRTPDIARITALTPRTAHTPPQAHHGTAAAQRAPPAASRAGTAPARTFEKGGRSRSITPAPPALSPVGSPHAFARDQAHVAEAIDEILKILKENQSAGCCCACTCACRTNVNVETAAPTNDKPSIPRELPESFVDLLKTHEAERLNTYRAANRSKWEDPNLSSRYQRRQYLYEVIVRKAKCLRHTEEALSERMLESAKRLDDERGGGSVPQYYDYLKSIDPATKKRKKRRRDGI